MSPVVTASRSKAALLHLTFEFVGSRGRALPSCSNSRGNPQAAMLGYEEDRRSSPCHGLRNFRPKSSLGGALLPKPAMLGFCSERGLLAHLGLRRSVASYTRRVDFRYRHRSRAGLFLFQRPDSAF